jgi:hypothetical protein
MGCSKDRVQPRRATATVPQVDAWIEEESARRREEAAGLAWLDVNAWLGAPVGFPVAEELHAPALPAFLARYAPGGALVSHWDALRLSAQDGNAALLGLEESLPEGAWTVWTGLPLLPREQDPLPAGSAPSRRLRGVRLLPRTHRFPLAGWCIGTLCAWLVERRMPLFVQHVEVDWRDVHELASAYPDLRLVVESQSQKILYHIRPVYNLLEACGNVLLEISNFAAADILTHAVRTLGADRFLYGSFAPVSDPLVAMGMVLDAALSAEEKALLAGGNARRLVEEVRV